MAIFCNNILLFMHKFHIYSNGILLCAHCIGDCTNASVGVENVNLRNEFWTGYPLKKNRTAFKLIISNLNSIH